ncbi:hypothetical protein LTR95_013437, partial [Oleoguttula sp. CCFEE 5521]
MDHPQQQPDPGHYAQHRQDDQQSGYFGQEAATHYQAPDLQYAQEPAYAGGQPQAYDQGSQHGSQYGPPQDQYQQPNVQYQQIPHDANQPDPRYVAQTASQVDPQMYRQAPEQQGQYADPQAYQADPQQHQQGQYVPQPGLDPQQPQYMPQPDPAQQQYYAPQSSHAMSQGQWLPPNQAMADPQRSQHGGLQYQGIRTASRASNANSAAPRQPPHTPSVASSRASTTRPAGAPSSHGSHRSHRSHSSQGPPQFAPQPQVPPQLAGFAKAPSQTDGYQQAPPQAAQYAHGPPPGTQYPQAPPAQDPRHVHFRQPSTSTIPQTPSHNQSPTPANPPSGLSPAQRAALREQELQSAHQRITSLQSEREAADVALAHQESLRHAKDPDDAMLRRVLRLSLDDYTAHFGTDEETQVAEALRRSQEDAPDMDDEKLRQHIHVAQMRSLEELAQRLQRRVTSDKDVGGASRVGGSSRRHGDSRRGGDGHSRASSTRSGTSSSSTVREHTPRPRRHRSSHVRSPLANVVAESDVGSVRSWAPTPTFHDPPLASPPAFVSYDPPTMSPSTRGIPPPRLLTPTPPVGLDAAQHARNVEEAERNRRFAEHAQRYGGRGEDANDGDEARTAGGGEYY